MTAPGQRYHPVRTAAVVGTWADGLITINQPMQAIVELEVDGLALHHVSQDQERFIDAFGSKVLPELAS